MAPLPTVVAGARYEAQSLPAPFGSPVRNLAPRLGIAWQPHARGPWVFRAGVGLFYDRYPLAFLNDAIQKDGIHAFEQYAVGADSIRAFTLSRGGALAAPIDGVVHSIYRPDPSFNSTPTYARKFTAGVERAVDPAFRGRRAACPGALSVRDERTARGRPPVHPDGQSVLGLDADPGSRTRQPISRHAEPHP